MGVYGKTFHQFNTHQAIDHQTFVFPNGVTVSGGNQTMNCNYQVGNVDVFVRGIKMAESEFTADDGTSVSIPVATLSMTAGDEITIIGRKYPTADIMNSSAVNISGGQVNNTSITNAKLSNINNSSGEQILTTEGKVTEVMIHHKRYNKDGTTRDNYARTAEDILAKYPNSANGEYWICPLEDDWPFKVYCDMTNGGWMKVFCYNTSGQVNGTAHYLKRNLYPVSSPSQFSDHQAATRLTYDNYFLSGLIGTEDIDAIQHSSGGYFEDEGFYTRSGNNSHNVRDCFILDKTRVFGCRNQIVQYHDIRVKAKLGYEWGWSMVQLRPVYSHREWNSTGASWQQNVGVSPTTSNSYAMQWTQNSSNNYAGAFYANDYVGTSFSNDTAYNANTHTMEKIGNAKKWWKGNVDAGSDYSNTPTHTHTGGDNFCGVFWVGTQSPCFTEFQEIWVKDASTTFGFSNIKGKVQGFS